MPEEVKKRPGRPKKKVEPEELAQMGVKKTSEVASVAPSKGKNKSWKDGVHPDTLKMLEGIHRPNERQIKRAENRRQMLAKEGKL